MARDIDSFLASGETVVASYEKNKDRYYATDRRLILTRNEHLEDAAYNHITKIIMDNVSHKILYVIGIIMLLVGLVLAVIHVVSPAIIIFVVGILFIILYFVLRGSACLIKLSSGDVILLPVTESSNIEAFIKAIRDQIR
jgi:membrane-bound ClpP family serine protease